MQIGGNRLGEYLKKGVKDHLDQNKNPYLMYEAIAAGGLAVKAFGGNYAPIGDAILIYDALFLIFNYDFTFHWPKK